MQRTKKKRQEKISVKKYCGIAKIKEKGKYKFVKYRFNYPDKFLQFLQKNFEDIAYINLFSNRGMNDGLQLGSWTKNNNWIYF
jgi:hypothetical protein